MRSIRGYAVFAVHSNGTVHLRSARETMHYPVSQTVDQTIDALKALGYTSVVVTK